jgi:hypothetical protein
METTIAVLSNQHAEAVNGLRLAAYGAAPGFTVQPPGILWNRSDDQSTILGAFADAALVATLRLEVVQDMALVERKLECPWSFPEPLELPVMVLSKMATSRAHQGHGLNALLRWWALSLAREWSLAQVIGTFVSGSPRERTMREMGYRFWVNADGWHAGDYHSTAPVLVCLLDMRTHGEQALAVCARTAGETHARSRWTGPRPERKIVEVVK